VCALTCLINIKKTVLFSLFSSCTHCVCSTKTPFHYFQQETSHESTSSGNLSKLFQCGITILTYLYHRWQWGRSPFRKFWSLEWPLDWLKTHLIYFLFLFQLQAVLCVGFFHADCVSASLIKIMSDTPGLLYFYSIESIAIHKFSVWRLEEWQNLNRIKDVFVNILFSPGDFLFYFFSKKQKLHKSSSFSCSCSPSLSLLVLNKDGNWNSFRGGLFDLRFLYFFLRFWFILRSFSLYRAREKEGNELFCLFDFIRIF